MAVAVNIHHRACLCMVGNLTSIYGTKRNKMQCLQLTGSVGAEGDGAEPGADGGGGAARGASGHPADAVGVARGAVVRVDAAGAGAQLVHVGLAGHHGAARAQLRHARRVRRAPPRRPQPPRAACMHAHHSSRPAAIVGEMVQ